MSVQPFIGEVQLFAGNFPPRGWAFCNGQLIAVSSNTSLFSLIGTIYGGDGRTTFALPDLRGCSPIGAGRGAGLSPINEGQRGGNETVSLTTNTMPNHEHTALTALDSDGGSNTTPSVGAHLAETDDDLFGEGTDVVSTTVTTTSTGSAQAINQREPFLGVHFIIALQGVFPSRS